MLRKIVMAGIVSTAAAFGCHVRTAQPVGYATVTSVPYDYYSYPHTYYGGRPVYWIENRWVYRDGGRWYGYQHEPAELYRYRTQVQQAPPARQYTPARPVPGGGYGPSPGYGPAPGGRGPVTAPPAATRVR